MNRLTAAWFPCPNGRTDPAGRVSFFEIKGAQQQGQVHRVRQDDELKDRPKASFQLFPGTMHYFVCCSRGRHPMINANELFATGLRNAHGMERQAQEMLERQIGRTDDYPEVKAKLQEHLAETKMQIRRLDSYLTKLDTSASSFKDAVLAFGANIAAMGHAMAGDEVLKNTFANSALEHYEIAAYKSLLVLAEHASISAIELQQSLDEEQRMAEWVDGNVEKITRAYIEKDLQS
jgi:ferritin-like metal-binding protein YciE